MLYVSRAVLLPRSDVKSVQRQRLADAGNNSHPTVVRHWRSRPSGGRLRGSGSPSQRISDRLAVRHDRRVDAVCCHNGAAGLDIPLNAVQRTPAPAQTDILNR